MPLLPAPHPQRAGGAAALRRAGSGSGCRRAFTIRQPRLGLQRPLSGGGSLLLPGFAPSCMERLRHRRLSRSASLPPAGGGSRRAGLRVFLLRRRQGALGSRSAAEDKGGGGNPFPPLPRRLLAPDGKHRPHAFLHPLRYGPRALVGAVQRQRKASGGHKIHERPVRPEGAF